MLHISPNDGKPIYLQIVQQLKYMIASGRLRPGDELPPIRTLAAELLINPNTVARAYRDLEQAGWLTKRQGAGTYVSDRGSPLAREEQLRLLGDRVDALLTEARQMNVGIEEVWALIQARNRTLGAFEGGTGHGGQQ